MASRSYIGDDEGETVAKSVSDPATFRGCGAGSASPANDWHCPLNNPNLCGTFGVLYPTSQTRNYIYSVPVRNTISGLCTDGGNNGLVVDRSRSVSCPDGMPWNPTTQRCTRAPSIFDPHKNEDTCPVSTGGSNPINCATGEKLQTENDFASPASPWLSFTRYYGSSATYTGSPLGSHWRHSFSRQLRWLLSPGQ